MGGADIIPGVSGGTIALILGIYERLVTAISHVDAKLFQHVKQRQWLAAAAHLDLRFLIALAAGIGTGILGLAGIMNYLLTTESTRPLTLAAFTGLILASSVLVGKMIRVKSARGAVLVVVLGIAGAVFAFWLTGLREFQGSDNLLYIFFTGAVAICAMILPGISGAFIMVIFGMYVSITDILKRLPKLNVNAQDLITLAVFAAGAGLSLILFSKFLRWLLARHEPQTMAVLCGFMLGSLRKIWPFQRDVTLERLDQVGLSAEKIEQIQADPTMLDKISLKHRAFEPYLPSSLTSEVIWALVIALAALAFVFFLDYISAGKASTEEPLRPEDHEPGASV